MQKYLELLYTYDGLKILIIVVALDTLFGILRAIKEKKVNSCIGIDGIIRKVGMILALIFLLAIDCIINLNLIGFIPDAILQIVPIKRVGISNLFNILFVIFEILSVFKNMILCKLPIPYKLQKYLERILKEFTSEIDEGGKHDEQK